ncbi:epithelial-stromal interaction protein 1 [Nannospalax galili]|uniref:epithelial-stromal interaction protein 1 n=1 Tax=Nannospalax galili TaxID=1026970 RepID=UPI0004ED6565|nr:epithelial-stromal interaction protein 1 [Nannospalax galili]
MNTRSTGTYTLIAPNENRRQQIQRIAEQELANLEEWKKQNRAKPVHLVPRQLGGSQSESEVRQKQQLQLMRSKYQQKRAESIQIRKEAEEAELQRMKAIQREKSNKLEKKKRLQENLRREAFREHHQYKTAEFLNKLDRNLQRDPQSSTWKLPVLSKDPSWASSQAHGDSLKKEENPKLQKMKDEQHQKNKLLETKQQQQEEERAKIQQAEHRRVNNAFLDRLQGKSQPGGFEQSGGCWNMNSANSWGI